MSYYPDYEPESLFIAQTAGQVVGALLGAVDTYQFENIYRKKIKPCLLMRTLAWKYGSPGWLPAILKTEWAEREVRAPTVDRSQYPAHLHIGVLPEWRRKGIGTELMNNFIEYLKINRIPGFHLYASSHHPMGIAFYEKLGLEKLGQFHWRLHDGFEWRDVIETIYGIQLS
jgi:ribosomal protein S18 acetylase RimI-like enzyme